MNTQDQPTNYGYASAKNLVWEEFTFADLTGSPSITSVNIYVYCDCGTEKIRVQVWDDGASSYVLAGDLQGSGWSWRSLDISSIITTDGEVDAAKVYFESKAVGGWGGSVAVDCSYLYVDYSSANSPPTIDSMRITETTDEIPITTLDVYVWYDWEIQVSDPDTLNDIVTVTARIMENPVVDIDADTPDFVEDAEYWVRFVNATNEWQWHSGSGWTTTSDYLDGVNCAYPTKSGTQGWYLFRVRLSTIAKKSSLWDFSGLVEDSQAQTDKDKIVSITVNLYLELSVTTTTHSWASVSAGDSDVLIDEGSVQFTATANNVFDVQAKGDGDLTGNGDTIPLSNVEVHKDTLGSATPLSVSYQDVGGLTSQAAGKDLAKSFLAWLTVPYGTKSNSYSYTLSIQVIQTP